MLLNKRYWCLCVLEAVLLLSLFSGTTALKPNGQQCLFASECESGACIGQCVDKRPLGENCTLDAPCANPENTTCNFQNVDVGLCELAKQPGEVCSNDLPQSRCIEPQHRCIQRRSFDPPKCLILLSNGQQIPEPIELFFCDTNFVLQEISNVPKIFCSDGNPGDICRKATVNDVPSCGGPACSDSECVCLDDRCFKKQGLEGDDCFSGTCAPGLFCIAIKKKCTAGEVGSPCLVDLSCGTKVIGNDLECQGGFCAKRGGIGQPCNGIGLGLTQGSCANGLRCSGRRGICGCRPRIGCP